MTKRLREDSQIPDGEKVQFSKEALTELCLEYNVYERLHEKEKWTGDYLSNIRQYGYDGLAWSLEEDSFTKFWRKLHDDARVYKDFDQFFLKQCGTILRPPSEVNKAKVRFYGMIGPQNVRKMLRIGMDKIGLQKNTSSATLNEIMFARQMTEVELDDLVGNDAGPDLIAAADW